jgi:GNAT superfamily N-acetyltransferase
VTVPWAPARWWEPLPDTPTDHGTLGVVDPASLVDLRRAVLRDGRTDLPAAYPTDQAPSTLHLGTVTPGGRAIGGVTVLVDPWPGVATLHLVLMAVDRQWQARGVGGALVRAVQGAAASAGYDVWAAARLSALDFYRGLGFRPAGDVVTGAMDLPHRRVRWHRPAG